MELPILHRVTKGCGSVCVGGGAYFVSHEKSFSFHIKTNIDFNNDYIMNIIYIYFMIFVTGKKGGHQFCTGNKKGWGYVFCTC